MKARISPKKVPKETSIDILRFLSAVAICDFQGTLTLIGQKDHVSYTGMMGNNILCMLYWHINAEVKDVFIEMDGPPSWILGAWMRRWYWWWDGISKGQRGLQGRQGEKKGWWWWCGVGGLRRRISATLIDCYLFPSPLAWKNTRSCMSGQINKKKASKSIVPTPCFSFFSSFFFIQEASL